MLPSREMNTTCLRCRRPLAEEERYCPGCGADRELELAIAAELDPAIASLERWLLVSAALLLGLSALVWEHYRDKLSPGALWSMVGSSVISGAALAALALLARRFPLPVAVIASVLFFFNWLAQLLVDPVGAVAPGLGLAVRIMFAIVLVGAIIAGFKARALRRNAAERFPQATARPSKRG
jgi:hypothetical protein